MNRNSRITHPPHPYQKEQVRVVMAPIKKYIVIQPSRINKGKALHKLLMKDEAFDLILGIGDERTDEDM